MRLRFGHRPYSTPCVHLRCAYTVWILASCLVCGSYVHALPVGPGCLVCVQVGQAFPVFICVLHSQCGWGLRA